MVGGGGGGVVRNQQRGRRPCHGISLVGVCCWFLHSRQDVGEEGLPGGHLGIRRGINGTMRYRRGELWTRAMKEATMIWGLWMVVLVVAAAHHHPLYIVVVTITRGFHQRVIRAGRQGAFGSIGVLQVGPGRCILDVLQGGKGGMKGHQSSGKSKIRVVVVVIVSRSSRSGMAKGGGVIGVLVVVVSAVVVRWLVVGIPIGHMLHDMGKVVSPVGSIGLEGDIDHHDGLIGLQTHLVVVVKPGPTRNQGHHGLQDFGMVMLTVEDQDATNGFGWTSMSLVS